MKDEEAIQRVLTTYSQCGSKGDWDTVLSLYLPDGVWHIPHLGLKFEGRAAVAEALASFSALMDYVLQFNGPALIDVDGDTARATSAIRECGKSAGKDEGFEYTGIYVDDLVRTGQGWKFACRRFDGIGSQLFALTSGVAH